MSDNISFDFTKPNRTVHSVFLHCSASDRPEHDSVNVIKKWHMARGFSGIGYHYFIHKNGVISNGRCLSKIPAAQRNYNSGSIAICLHGLKREKFTEKQYVSLRKLCSAIDSAYDNKLRFRGHCEVAAKSCPVFDYKKELNLSDEGKLQSSLLHSPMNLAQLRQNTCALFSTGSRVRVILNSHRLDRHLLVRQND